MIFLLGVYKCDKEENLKYIFLTNMKRGECYNEYEDRRECYNGYGEKKVL